MLGKGHNWSPSRASRASMAYEDERKGGGQVVKERCDNVDGLSDTGQFIGALDRAIEDRRWMGRAS
jgi:hypothetical protein